MQGTFLESSWNIYLISSVLQGLAADIKVLVANPVRPEFLAVGADGILQTWDLTSHELRGGRFPALVAAQPPLYAPRAPPLPCKQAQQQL